MFPRICEDTGGKATASKVQRKKVLSSLSSSEAFRIKGERVAFKRWFSWLRAAEAHDKVWHSRLLCMLYLGIKTGVWKGAGSCPYWAGGDAAPGPEEPGEEEDSDPEEKKDVAEAAATGVAKAKALAASSSGEAAEFKTNYSIRT